LYERTKQNKTMHLPTVSFIRWFLFVANPNGARCLRLFTTSSANWMA